MNLRVIVAGVTGWTGSAVARGIMASDRMRREEAEALGRTLGQELKITKLEGEVKAAAPLAPRQPDRRPP